MVAKLVDWIVTHFVPLARTGLLAALGLWAGWILGRLADRHLRKKISVQAAILTGRVIRYLFFILVSLSVLRQLGFDIGAFLGAAGVAGIAIGFASQTSLSNLVSGFFLIFESPFKIGDVVEIDTITGTVDNIALLSDIKRRFDAGGIEIPFPHLSLYAGSETAPIPIRMVGDAGSPGAPRPEPAGDARGS